MRLKFFPKFLALAVGLLFLAGCTVPGSSLQFYHQKPCQKGTGDDVVQLTYLGAGGHLIRRGEASILVSPFFSNPGILRVGFSKIKSRTKIVDRFLPPVADIETIIVGHSHYDHLLDLPHIATHHAVSATIYGNTAMTRLLAPFFKNKQRLVSLNAKAGNHKKVGEWVYISKRRIRFMAVEAEHAPHYHGVSFFSGKTPNADRLQPPRKASDWVTGRVFAFIIDFLGPYEETVDFRIHYQDAAANPPFGFPPKEIDGIDLAILCAASFHEVRNYPERFLAEIKPRHIIVGHWENFFRSYTKPPRTVPFTNVKKFIEKVKTAKPEGVDCHVPKPGACITYRILKDRVQ